MNEIIAYLQKIYLNNPDLIIRKINTNKNEKVYIVFFESLVNSNDVYEFAIKSITQFLNDNSRINSVYNVINSPKIQSLNSENEISYYLENGFFAIIYKEEIYVAEAKAALDRGINTSDTEPNMYGPKDAFCENYQKNLGLIKRRIKSKNLQIESQDLGYKTKTKVSLCYLNDLVNYDVLEQIKSILENNKNINVTDSKDITNLLEKSKLFPTIYKTEKPSLIANFILKGNIVILIDNTPFCLVMDTKFNDFINPLTTDKFISFIRYVCLILTILAPAIYIALINFNQESIPTSLLLNFMKQRAGVPFPAVIEAFMMLFICEILRETDIRFPNSYGSSASILGALILGEAAVNAGLVSPIMIIIIAITFITNLIFTEIQLVWAIRIFRFSLLIIASFLGLYGLSLGIIAAICLVAKTKMYGGNYL